MTKTKIAFTILAAIVAAILADLAAAPAQALDKVSFGTNWVAEAEHGGFYQALRAGSSSALQVGTALASRHIALGNSVGAAS